MGELAAGWGTEVAGRPSGPWVTTPLSSLAAGTILMTISLPPSPPQAGGCGRGGLHPHPASAGRRAAEGPRRGDGPTGGGPGHLPVHGPGSAEVPAGHSAAALPQHGKHPTAPGLLHHQQHDPQGAAWHELARPVRGMPRSGGIKGPLRAPTHEAYRSPHTL